MCFYIMQLLLMISIPEAEMHRINSEKKLLTQAQRPIIGSNYDKKRKQEAKKKNNDPINPKVWL